MLTLTLLVPGLSQAPSIHGAGLDALTTLLRRADAVRTPMPAGFERRVFALFGAEIQQEELPAAPVTHLADTGRRDSGWRLRADPVHLHLEGNRLVLMDDPMLGLTQTEADQLLLELLPLCPPGWRLEAPYPGRWYLQPATPLKLQTTPLSAAVGLDVQPRLPSGEDAARLRAWLTELQMQLHASPLNATREMRGELPVNSLWFWGGGRLPSLDAPAWTRVWAMHPLVQGLAHLAGIPVTPPPTAADNWLQQAAPGRHLLVLDQGLHALQYRDETAWRQFVDLLTADWIAPLLSMLRQKRLSGMILYSDIGPGWEMTLRQLRRWWRSWGRDTRFAPNLGSRND